MFDERYTRPYRPRVVPRLECCERANSDGYLALAHYVALSSCVRRYVRHLAPHRGEDVGEQGREQRESYDGGWDVVLGRYERLPSPEEISGS